MFVIIEGPKCSGKTTMCAKLAERFGGTVIHFPTNSEYGSMALEMLRNCQTDDDYEKCQDMMELDIISTLADLDFGKLWILDRSFISNAVYRQTDKVRINPVFQSILDQSMVVVLTASTENLEKWSEARTEKPLNTIEKAKLEWSNERFQNFAKDFIPIPGSSAITELTPKKYIVFRTGLI